MTNIAKDVAIVRKILEEVRMVLVYLLKHEDKLILKIDT